jgi:hypothetical protein
MAQRKYLLRKIYSGRCKAAAVVLAFVLCGAAIGWGTSACAQQPAAAQEAAKRMDTVPPFRITEVGGHVFTKSQLKPHTPLMIVYFSPTCDHCQHFVQALAPHLDQFKGTQIVMVTFVPVTELVNFAKAYKLDKPFIRMGTEGFSFIVRNYFNIQTFPFIALYDKHGKLVKTYREPPSDISLLSNGLFRKVK